MPPFLEGGQLFMEHLRDNIFFARKIIKEGALGNIDTPGDVLNRGILKALFSKKLLCGL